MWMPPTFLSGASALEPTGRLSVPHLDSEFRLAGTSYLVEMLVHVFTAKFAFEFLMRHTVGGPSSVGRRIFAPSQELTTTPATGPPGQQDLKHQLGKLRMSVDPTTSNQKTPSAHPSTTPRSVRRLAMESSKDGADNADDMPIPHTHTCWPPSQVATHPEKGQLKTPRSEDRGAICDDAALPSKEVPHHHKCGDGGN
jgi:hypothetical protein